MIDQEKIFAESVGNADTFGATDTFPRKRRVTRTCEIFRNTVESRTKRSQWVSTDCTTRDGRNKILLKLIRTLGHVCNESRRPTNSLTTTRSCRKRTERCVRTTPITSLPNVLNYLFFFIEKFLARGEEIVSFPGKKSLTISLQCFYRTNTIYWRQSFAILFFVNVIFRALNNRKEFYFMIVNRGARIV